MAIEDITPGEMNKLLVAGDSRQITSDDIDASGRGLYRHKRVELNRLIETNLFAGMTKFKAQVLTKSVERTSGPGIFQRLFGGGDVPIAAARLAARIRIPEIHQSIPHPFNYVPGTSDFKTFMMGHPVAIYEPPTTGFSGFGGEDKLAPGDIVWVVFEKGAGGSRFYQPVIESVYSRGSGDVQTPGQPQNASGAHAAGTAFSSSLNPLSAAQVNAIANEPLDNLDTCEKAIRLHNILMGRGMTSSAVKTAALGDFGKIMFVLRPPEERNCFASFWQTTLMRGLGIRETTTVW
mgnify:CR=1 FL=1